ncbi:Ribosomal protein L7Ae/L30e/S12e/Gadd45 [Artemisia annua]|uniref:Ribosomal protein L7Ae/L30e/S12e/Gadd45 n=1 Tax=Artemisia annua TaxID=35608 RepID=A0A2U1NLR0_ARTAN|nr:Ribosomal protein L7Ae/L30e/S12e/Gadd45 [Artemisia annua]
MDIDAWVVNVYAWNWVFPDFHLPNRLQRMVESQLNEEENGEGALPPKKDVHRFLRWPQVVRIQRKRRIIKQRLKVLVVWLPVLCRKMEIPYCIVKGKSRLRTICPPENCSFIVLDDCQERR